MKWAIMATDPLTIVIHGYVALRGDSLPGRLMAGVHGPERAVHGAVVVDTTQGGLSEPHVTLRPLVGTRLYRGVAIPGDLRKMRWITIWLS